MSFAFEELPDGSEGRVGGGEGEKSAEREDTETFVGGVNDSFGSQGFERGASLRRAVSLR